MFRGASELAARDDLALEWFNALQAPRKHMYRLDHAGHPVLTERPDRLARCPDADGASGDLRAGGLR